MEGKTKNTKELTLNDLAVSISDLASAVKIGFDEVYERMDGVESRLGHRIDSVEIRLGCRIDVVEGRLGGVEGRLNGVEGKLESVENRLSKTEDGIYDLGRKVSKR
jgi:hypothetical protein